MELSRFQGTCGDIQGADEISRENLEPSRMVLVQTAEIPLSPDSMFQMDCFKLGLSVQRIISESKKITTPVKGKLGADDNSSNRKSNAMSLKMLLEKEISKEAQSKRRTPSVIARLMGLEEDLPTKEPIVHHTVSDLSRDLNATNNTLQGKERHQFTMLKTQNDQSCHEKIEYNDVYEVPEAQSGAGYFHDQTSQKGWSSENKSKQFDLTQDKIMEPEHFAIEERHLCTKELPEAPIFPCPNRDLSLEFPEEHNLTFSRRSSGLDADRAPPQTQRITVLKPIRSGDISGIRQSKTEIGKQNVLKMRRFHQIPSSKEENQEIPSQSSRIVLLRPTPGKPGISKAKLTSRATSFQLTNRNSLNGSLDDNQASIGSAGLVHGIMQRWQDGCHQRDDSILSSAYSNGYGGDESSFSDSEVDYTSGSEINYIEDGDTRSGSEGGSPLSQHSWNYLRRSEGQCSSSSFSRISHFSESSVIMEAKKQLSERWSMVTCNEMNQVQLSRRKCTLGEMLSIKEAKKDEATTGMFSVPGNQSCGLENELTTHSTNVTTSGKNDDNGEISSRKLPRSKSVPVISSMSDDVVNVQASNAESRKLEAAVVSNKGKSAFKGRVSDFFLSKSKRPRRRMSTYHPSDCFAERLEGCIIHSRQDCNHEMDAIEKVMHCEDRFDSFSAQISTSTSDRTSGASVSLDSSTGNLDKLGVHKCINSNRDQPSPTSVLDAPSEDSSCNEPETTGTTTSKNAISRSSAIETVSRFLSWDDTASDSQSLRNPRPSSLLPDVDDDESECHVLVQNIMSSAGFGASQSRMVFTGWHLPDHPLDPVLCNKVSQLQAYRRLLFDCVNVALIEIGENTLLSALPWSKRHSRTWRGTSSPDLGVEVWSILKDWIYGARMFVVSKRDNAGIILDRIVKQEVEARGWVKLMMAQVVDITEELEGGVMEELIEEAVLDFTVCFQ